MKIKKIPVNSLRVGVFSEHCHQYTDMCLIYTLLFSRILMCIIFRYTLSTVSEIWYFSSDLALFRAFTSETVQQFGSIEKKPHIFLWMTQRKKEVRISQCGKAAKKPRWYGNIVSYWLDHSPIQPRHIICFF